MRGRRHGRRDGVRRAGFEGSGDGEDRAPVRSHAGDVRNGEPAFGQCPRLVERDRADPAHRFERPASLDEHPRTGRRTDRRYDRRGRRDDERAGTREHEKRQRPVDPGLPGQPENERRNDGDERRRDHHGRGVPCREPLDHRLDGRPVGLRLLDEPDDLRERASRSDGCRFDRDGPPGVQRPRENGVPLPLRGRNGFSRD